MSKWPRRIGILGIMCLVWTFAPTAELLAADEKDVVGTWIETSHYSETIELFDDGVATKAEKVFGSTMPVTITWNWKLLSDGRLRLIADTQAVMGDASTVSDGYVYMHGDEYIRYKPELRVAYAELAGALEAYGRATSELSSAVKEIRDVKRKLADALVDRTSVSRIEKAFDARFAGLEERVNSALSSCEGPASRAIQDSPGFGRSYIVLGQCLEASIKHIDVLQGMANTDFLTKERAAYSTRVISVYVKAIQAGLSPNWEAVAFNTLAWVHSTSIHEKLRNGPLAVRYARKAVALFPEDASYLDTLAAAYARRGEYSKAVEAEEHALRLLQQSEGSWKAGFKRKLSLYKDRQPYVDIPEEYNTLESERL